MTRSVESKGTSSPGKNESSWVCPLCGAGGQKEALAAKIPYEEINPEIRWLVRFLNTIAGVETLYSCAGHGAGEDWIRAYVIFRASSLSDIEALMLRLRDLELGWDFTDSHRAIRLCAWDHEWHGLVFSLLIIAKGLDNHRRFLQGIQRVLSRYGASTS